LAEEKNKRLIAYIGSDENYWKTIRGRIQQSYSHMNFEFVSYFPEKASLTQRLFVKILKEMPRIIYIDYSVRINEHISLTNLINRDNILKNIAVCGLVDNKSNIKDCLAAGADFLHVKCGEYYDVVYDPFYYAFPKEVKNKVFAKANCKKDVLITDDFRVGYITPTHLHIETNLELEEGSSIILKTQLPEKNVPSRKFFVEKVSKSNLYYDYANSVDLAINFVDEPSFDEVEFTNALSELDPKEKVRMLKEAKQKKQQDDAEYESKLKFSKKKHREWVFDNLGISTPKSTKILIVDRQMSIFNESSIKNLDEYPYVVRCQTVLDEKLSDIDRVMPNIVVIQCFSDLQPDGESEQDDEIFATAWKTYIKYAGTETDGNYQIDSSEHVAEISAIIDVIKNSEHEEMERIEKVIKKIKTIESYHPFIILFNCPFINSKALQETYLYPMIAVYKEPIIFESVLNLAKTLETKQKKKQEAKINAKIMQLRQKDPRKYGRLTPGDFEDKKFFIKKSDKLSYVSYGKTIRLESITESEAIISTEEKLELRSYLLNFPVDLSIKLVPTKEGRKFFEEKGRRYYKALIHSIGENDKKHIRRYVNEVFGAPMKEQEAQELEDFKQKQLEALENTVGGSDDIER